MSTRSTPSQLVAFCTVLFDGHDAVIQSQDGGIASIATTGPTACTLTLIEPFDADAAEVACNVPPTLAAVPTAASCSLDGPAGTIHVECDRAAPGFQLSLRQVVGAVRVVP